MPSKIAFQKMQVILIHTLGPWLKVEEANQPKRMGCQVQYSSSWGQHHWKCKQRKVDGSSSWGRWRVIHEGISGRETGAHWEWERRKKTLPMLKSQREFAALGKETLKSSNKIMMRYGVLPEESIDWDILGDTEHHQDMEFQPPTSARVVTSNFVPIQNNFFENVFPSIGHMHVLSINFCQIHVPHFIQLLWQATSGFMIHMMMTLTGRQNNAIFLL